MTPKIVPKATPTIVDFGVIESGIHERETNVVSRNIAFSCLVLETIFAVPHDEVLEHITDGGDDRGIDFVLIDHGNKRINIASCKTVAHHRSMLKNFPGDEIDKIISFTDDLLIGREDLLNSCNGKLCSKIREIWDIFANETYVISVHLFSNQATLARDARNRLSIALERHDIALYEYGLFELSHGVVKATKPKFQKKLIPIGDAVLATDTGKRAIVTAVGIPALTNFLAEDGIFDQRLIWQNVRYFLGIENEVNKEIRETLISGQAKDFWYLNSGLTIVCDQIISQANGRHPISMVNPQIVNGCQTATVIHEVATTTLLDLTDGRVQVKIIETRDPSFVERIALASNTQSRILSRDLRANDELQRQLVECLRKYGYSYLRKRGEKPRLGNTKIIDSARAGQLLLSYLCREPTKSKTDSNEIFGDLYEEAFNPHAVTPEIIIAAHECYSEIERRRREALAWQASVSRNSFEETWIIEGHFHLLFVVGEIMRRSEVALDNSSVALSLIDPASEIIAKYVEKNKRTAGYRLFRLSRSRDEILRIMDGIGKATAAGPIQGDFFETLELLK